jgi:uncharacterized protein with FMN-binding domain
MDQPAPAPDPATPDKGRASSGKMTNSLVALSSAAILTVYAAGYLRTRAAAERFTVGAADLRTAGPIAGPPAAAAPREFDGIELPQATPAVPASPVPPSAAAANPSGIVSPEPSPAPIADANGPAGPDAQPSPQTEEPLAPSTTSTSSTSSPGAPTPNPAPVEVDAAAAAPAAPKDGKYKDGTFSGWGYSRHGDIQAAVVVQDGRVVSAEITQCLTRYSCDVIDMLPAQVLSRQNAFVDLISGVTESANAYSNAIYRALVLSQK